jgi:hypothetical protein
MKRPGYQSLPQILSHDMDDQRPLSLFPVIKYEQALILFDHFMAELQQIAPVRIHPHKTMISIANARKPVAYITQAGKSFIHVVFPFKQRYDDNHCFQRIQEVPGRRTIYHHFRMLSKDDINDEVRRFMRLAHNLP